MNWNIVQVAQESTSTGGIQITVTLGFCNAWCTGGNISCCGGQHDVYYRITQQSGNCTACPSGNVPIIIGPINAGYVGPPYNANNPTLPSCPAELGDQGNIQVPIVFEGCPGEAYLVEVLAVNRTTLANCGGISQIPNVCTNGCNYSPFTDWLAAEGDMSPGGIFTIPGTPEPPALTVAPNQNTLMVDCGDGAQSFDLDYSISACRDIPGTSMDYEFELLNAPACIAISNTPADPSPCISSNDNPFGGIFNVNVPAYADMCDVSNSPCMGPWQL